MKTKRYTIEYGDDPNRPDKLLMKRTCEGFNSFELLGILEFIQREVRAQIMGEIKPDFIERQVIQETTTEQEKKERDGYTDAPQDGSY